MALPLEKQMRRHPVATSIAAGALLASLLVLVWWVVPLSGRADHAGLHLTLALPILTLLVLALRYWPASAPGRDGWIVRGTLLSGLAVYASGLLIEAVGAFGYRQDGVTKANNLVIVHDIGVAIGPVGFALTVAGAIMSAGLALASRRGAAGSRWLTGAIVVAAVAVLAFAVGGLIFGY